MSSRLKIDTRVRGLKAYLEEFENGSFQIPTFQRDFLWSHDDIKELFDSIKNNYPIGSILFWKPTDIENSERWNEPTFIGPYKVIDKKKIFEATYILDGFQRLSSLFGCLTNPYKYNRTNLEINEKKWKDKFNLYYDLEEEQFIYLRQGTKNLYYQVPVYIFMNSIDFRQYARKEFENNDEEKIELYYDRADALGQTLNNYQIASVDLTSATIQEAVEIFRRVNEKGLPISKDWIVSALTNTDDFRLGTEIDKLLEDLKIFNFDKLKRDIVFQCIQNSFGKIYFDFKIEDLLKRSDFVETTKKTLTSVRKTVEFLYEYLLVLNNQLLPYNNQFIFLTSFFSSIDTPTDQQIIQLKRWFWFTTYSNYFTIYSLSNQRKAFEQFEKFINGIDEDPIYIDDKNSSFTTQDFPSKIYMGSVRSKALALFMMNYSKGIYEINLAKISADSIESFEIGNLFSIPQRENPSENFVPIIKEVYAEKDDLMFFRSLSRGKRANHHNFLLKKVNAELFIDEEMVELFEQFSLLDEDRILELRKELIIKAEKQFVNSLDIVYSESLPF